MKHATRASGPGGHAVIDHHLGEDERETLILSQLPLAATLARRYAGGRHVAEQFIEAALVGLVRAIDSFDPTGVKPFEQYAEALIVSELEQLSEDYRSDREDRILRRDQAAVRAIARIEDSLLAQPRILMLAMSLGFRADDLAFGFLAAVIRQPELMSVVASPGVCDSDQAWGL
jgi:RNA polymerase sigma-B factor